MYILGVSGGFKLGYQDAAAVLMHNGKVIAAIEEERISRIKHAPSVFPYYAIKEVLGVAKITINEVAEVATHGITWGDDYRNDVSNFFLLHFGFCPKLSFWHHHDAHAAGAFFSSGFTESMIVSIDNSGDGVSTQLAIGRHSSIEIIEQYKRPQSLGIFYSALTQFCGFKKDNDEYKLMGLSAFSKAGTFNLEQFLRINSDGKYSVNEEYLVAIPKGMPQPSQQQKLYSDKLRELVGIEPRIPNSNISEQHIQLAKATQELFEGALIAIVKKLYHQYKIPYICLSGGAALNCVANGKIEALDFIDEVFIQPAASDAGIAMGCAQLASINNRASPKKITSTYLGRSFSDEAIKEALTTTGVLFTEVDNIAEVAASYLAENKIIGWFQGAAEFGPRALGNRSILASASSKTMTDKLNQKIKFREAYRPFCPIVLEHDSSLYFEVKKPAPYMTIAVKCKPLALEKIPAGVHADNSARIQTVSKNSNELLFELLEHYKKLTGTGVLLNTSFNRNSEPIVDSPFDALSSFFGSGLDALFIGRFLVLK